MKTSRKTHHHLLEEEIQLEDFLELDTPAVDDAEAEGIDEFECILQRSDDQFRGTDDLLYRYYTEVGRYPLLTAEEERKYGLLAQKGDKRARNILIQSNLRLVVMIARRQQRQGIDLLDLISEGNLGLNHAIEKYEAERNYRFSTYAVWWIRHYISSAIMNQSRIIRVPVHVNKAIARLVRIAKELAQTLKREPTIKELAKESGLTIYEVMNLLADNEAIFSLDALITQEGDGQDFHHIIPDQESLDIPDQLTKLEKSSVLESILDSLEENEKAVIIYRFGLNGRRQKTLDETGEKLSLTRDQVRYLQMKTLEKMKRLLDDQKVEINDLLYE
ncbi:sigma-70 family RNA polymerase sigma factor [Ignatzschineria cameli]|uniref:RNA polymerase sigma factor RpoS n=1 Tax=Ignatzschineria cameli TaxID=2182793 RepID=A0A2U2ASG0_9GAMM|nr:sigma-70 family RNA polymerase sigma factor [Ignatzschineria cameli]PWD86446.1 RNA polymerase sigma factor RpoS [Ignatzschineria cameli]PWD87200.1 RNA polymerase sigma factor RpoS [Ignatzschineria cameli]PWD92174.1 RNA polymerase sigma factor RpoS [Ignatzschineria cameli]PWD93241.1 RNA polymerase sigma factor RpoS [Ignatzschineria cameli]PWD93983.1 RNA polymerase sigma factor RpoS [Ignatzschineria cameli]